MSEILTDGNVLAKLSYNILNDLKILFTKVEFTWLISQTNN